MTLWSWAGKHAAAVKLGSLAAALALLVGGLLLGMNQASGNPAPAGEVGSTPPANLAKQTSHYIVGTIAIVLPARREAIVRQRNGRLVQVSFDAATVVRRDRAREAQTALRRGTRVIILGEPVDGQLHAKVVTITGQAPVRTVTPTRPPAPAPATPEPKPSLSPVPAHAAAPAAAAAPVTQPRSYSALAVPTAPSGAAKAEAAGEPRLDVLAQTPRQALLEAAARLHAARRVLQPRAQPAARVLPPGPHPEIAVRPAAPRPRATPSPAPAVQRVQQHDVRGRRPR